MSALTPREQVVLGRLRYLASRNGGRIAAAEVGSAGAVESLRRKGYVRVILAEYGPQGGHYWWLVPVDRETAV